MALSKRHVARYTISSGLSGCYIPDNISGPYEFATRKHLAQAIRAELEYQDWPDSLFREVKIRDLWRFIQRHGSSSAHFRIRYRAHEIAFHGLTEEEFRNENEQE